jgi:UDP-2,4-diacetamido-2,4,6-trideoxy-beta-L-altropyranose hydrolase
MKVVFRADASVKVGSGHVMRCLTLADALRAQGLDTYFLCRPDPGHLGTLIEGRGHRLAWLPERSTLTSDAGDSSAVLAGEAPWDWLVVDHYGLDAAWEAQLRGVARQIMAIDDLADRPHDCDLLLDQNLQKPGRYVGLVPDSCTLLIGPKYALLRPQFAAARQALPARVGQVYRLLVFCGGADATGETLKALAAIGKLGRADLAVDVVIGQANPHRVAIEAACRALPDISLYCQVDDMAARMSAADLFVGAGGTSSWERCALGLPALVIATADNQVVQSEALARAGAQLYLGPAQSVTPERLSRLLGEILNLPDLLVHMAEQGQMLVDGMGVERVMKFMLA